MHAQSGIQIVTFGLRDREKWGARAYSQLGDVKLTPVSLVHISKEEKGKRKKFVVQ